MPGWPARRMQRLANKYDRMLAKRQAKTQRKQQAVTQKAQPRIQHIQNIAGQITAREQARDTLIQDRTNLLGKIQASRFPSMHLIKRTKARIMQARINSKNRQITRRTKRMARQQRIVDRHMTRAAAHAGVIPILEAEKQQMLFPGLQMGQTPPGFVPAPPPASPGQQPAQGGGRRRPRRRGRQQAGGQQATGNP